MMSEGQVGVVDNSQVFGLDKKFSDLFTEIRNRDEGGEL